MDRKKAEKLMQLHKQGYMVLIDDSRYVETAVTDIYQKDGEIVYDSNLYTGRKLSTVLWDGDVTVWKNVTDWDVDKKTEEGAIAHQEFVMEMAQKLDVSPDLCDRAIRNLKAKGLIQEVSE